MKPKNVTGGVVKFEIHVRIGLSRDPIYWITRLRIRVSPGSFNDLVFTLSQPRHPVHTRDSGESDISPRCERLNLCVMESGTVAGYPLERDNSQYDAKEDHRGASDYLPSQTHIA